ncbi:MAG: PTS sugar transporter subunit IIB [Proteobacteria bacterium]|nr:PTS sugar transporter subunit IIB [Pseudomonadota bacterium]
MSGHVYLRVDNRLLHGQVVQFWIGHLGIVHLIIANDDVAQNEAISTIYRMALPETVGLTVASISNLSAELKRCESVSTMVLIRDVCDVTRALTYNVVIDRVTLGNVHAAPERERVTDSVYLSNEEIQSLSDLTDHGIEVEIQTFPGETLRLAVNEKGGARWSKP